MKVVILAGGFGTRLSEHTELMPKPMIPIGGEPILVHIMKSYAKFGHKDFLLALGYKSELIKSYFLDYGRLNSDFLINTRTGFFKSYQSHAVDWNVSLFNTGLKTMTGGRLKRLKEYIGEETFMLTYGDGLSDVNMTELLEFHRSHKKMITVTAVRPNARFGELLIEGKKVSSFVEKPQLSGGRINGGFFVIEPKFLDLIAGDETLLEREPLELAASDGELMAFCHDGFWHCMDTKRDLERLEQFWAEGDPPWDRD